MGKSHNRFRRFCAFVIGIVFLSGGIFKLLDPVGSGLIMESYFKFLHLDFLNCISLWAAEFFAFAETFTGILLISGVFRKVTAIVTSVLLTLFTALTVLLVIFNPSMDCGCFGEVIHLTHWESLFKNVILDIFAAIAFIPFRDYGEPLKKKYVSAAIAAISCTALAVYSLLYIPLVDFTDFRPGSRLEASLETVPDIYKATFVYEKDGVKRNFSLENLPDSTWTFVSTETSLETERSDERIASLSFRDSEGNYCDSIATVGKVLAFSVYSPENLSLKKWKSMADKIAAANREGFVTILLSRDLTELDRITEGLPPEERHAIVSSAYSADYKTIVSLNRSNGGVTCFHDGHLVRKWAARSFPDFSSFEADGKGSSAEEEATAGTRQQLTFQAFLLYVYAVLFFI